MIQKVVNLACQTWFGLCTVVGLALDWAGCMAFTMFLPASEAQTMCCKWCHYMFLWFLIKSCPWIRVSPPSAEDFDRLLGREGVCMLMNHTSFFDSVLFVGITPPHIVWRYRTLMANKLFKTPFLGGVSRMVGHFPVFFTTNDEHSFVVDKTKQAETMIQVKAHVKSGGCLSLFPEGKINRNPETICPFRRGTFSLVEEMDMAVVTLTTVGCNDAWPRENAVGGLPSRISMKLTEVTKAGQSLSAAVIQEKAEAIMQAEVTFMRGQRNRSIKPKES